MSHSSWRRKHKDPNITVSTLASAIRRAEEDAERRWKITFEQWKMNELSKMRVDESRKAKQSVRRLYGVESFKFFQNTNYLVLGSFEWIIVAH